MSDDRPRFDAAAAKAYDQFVGRWSRLYIPTLLAGAEVSPGQSVLDLATGTGEAAMLASSLVGSSGSVVGVDISQPMLRAGQHRVADTPITLAAMDGQALAIRDQSFDAVICQLGLMFFPDVLRGLGEVRRVLRPGGRLAAGVWSKPERVPLVSILTEALSRQLPAQRGDLYLGFSLGHRQHLEGLFKNAGFQDIRVTTETRQIVFESFDDYWGPVEAGGARLGQAYRSLSEDARRAVAEEVGQRLSEFASGGRFVMAVEALFGLARA